MSAGAKSPWSQIPKLSAQSSNERPALGRPKCCRGGVVQETKETKTEGDAVEQTPFQALGI